MKKVLEGLFTYRGTDTLVATTNTTDSAELEAIRSAKALYAELRNIDRYDGLLIDQDVTPDYGLVSYYYLAHDNGRATLATCHIYEPNVDEGSYFRGNPEFVHYVTIEKNLDFRSVDLFNLSTLSLESRELEKIVVNNESFHEINESELRRLKVECDKIEILANKTQIVTMVDYILYAKKMRKTLYVCYEIDKYKEFKDALFLALRFLPKEITNDISFITLFGGGITTNFDIVGVPTDNEDILHQSGYLMNGVIAFYPFEDTPKEEIIDNEFHRLMDKITSQNELQRLDRFIYQGGKSYSSFDGYLLAFELYAPLFDKINRFEGNENEFITHLNRNLDYLKNHLRFIEEELSDSDRQQIIDNLVRAFNDIPNISNFGESEIELYRQIISSLIYITQNSKDKMIVEFAYNSLLMFIFNFRVDHNNESMVSFHNTLIDMLFNDPEYARFTKFELIRYIYPRREKEVTALLSENALMSSHFNRVSSLYFETLLRYLLDNYSDLNYPKTKVVELLLLVRSSLSQKERITLLFEVKGLSMEDKIDILIDIILKNSDEEGDAFIATAIEYFKENDLLIEVIPLVKATYYQSKSRDDLVGNFKKELIDSYIDEEIIDNYEKLKLVIDKLYQFPEGSDEFNATARRIIDYHLIRFDIESISKITIRSFESEEKEHFELIKKLLKRENSEVAKSILKAIEEKNAEKDTSDKAKRLEEDLILFRVEFLSRIMTTLPIRVSRRLIKKNSHVSDYAERNAMGDYLTLKGEAYSQKVAQIVEGFFTFDNNNPNQEAILETRRKFASDIVNAQNEKKFNIRNVTSAIYNLMVSIIIGAALFALTALGSYFSRAYITKDSYTLAYIGLSLLVGVISFFITMINAKNKGRKPFILISVLEGLAIAILGLGAFVLIFLLGGK